MPPLSPLPIDDVLPELLGHLSRQPCVVLQAPTGAGKTTRVPPAILDARLAGAGRILLLEPRRLAARAAARRIASERGAVLGQEIGWHVRFDRKASSATRIVAATPGIVLRYLLEDPFLESVGAVVFDEFHERSLESDLAFGLIRSLQQTVRHDLRIVVMSATLDAARIAQYLGGCPVVVSEGRLHPVEVRYEPKPPTQPWLEATVNAVRQLLRRTEGDMLVFLPGMSDIRQTERELQTMAERLDLAVLPLHGDLPPEQQDAALQPQSRHRIVLSTNVAETSVTVAGISAVVDSGLAKQLVFDPAVGLDRLELAPISRSSADQRAGRAGRERPGVCVRLWSEAQQRSRPEQTEPEIRRVDLAGAMLTLAALGETSLERFPWLDPPDDARVRQSAELLQRLGAIHDSRISDLGRAMAQLLVHPRLARMLVESVGLGCGERAAMAAAILGERWPFQRLPSRPGFGRRASSASDVLDAVEALEEFERTGRTESVCGELHRGAARTILQARDQLVRAITDCGSRVADFNPKADEPFLRALYVAFPDRLIRRRNPGGDKGVMIGGRGVRLAPTSGVIDGELFVGVDVDAGQAESQVRLASRVEREWLPADAVTTSTELAFDPRTERVVARRRVRVEDLLLEDREAPLPEGEAVALVLAAAAQERIDTVLPAADSPTMAFLTRLRCLRAWMPELQLPDFDGADMKTFLTDLCSGRSSLKELRSADWLGLIRGRLTYQQAQAMDREAPERIEVPSGSKLALTYEVGRPPVLAVRIQELFGLTATPRVAGGRAPVLLHLLAPNGRPQQVTDDLTSFWANTYPQVRKDLRARYPKHAWPEDPLTATPTSRAKKRGT